MNSLIIILSVLALCFVVWFALEWNKQRKFHKMFIDNLKRGDKVKYYDNELSSQAGIFVNRRGNKCDIINSRGEDVTLSINHLFNNYEEQ